VAEILLHLFEDVEETVTTAHFGVKNTRQALL